MNPVGSVALEFSDPVTPGMGLLPPEGEEIGRPMATLGFHRFPGNLSYNKSASRGGTWTSPIVQRRLSGCCIVGLLLSVYTMTAPTSPCLDKTYSLALSMTG